jgi:hypothetical protein
MVFEHKQQSVQSTDSVTHNVNFLIFNFIIANFLIVNFLIVEFPIGKFLIVNLLIAHCMAALNKIRAGQESSYKWYFYGTTTLRKIVDVGFKQKLILVHCRSTFPAIISSISSTVIYTLTVVVFCGL